MPLTVARKGRWVLEEEEETQGALDYVEEEGSSFRSQRDLILILDARFACQCGLGQLHEGPNICRL